MQQRCSPVYFLLLALRSSAGSTARHGVNSFTSPSTDFWERKREIEIERAPWSHQTASLRSPGSVGLRSGAILAALHSSWSAGRPAERERERSWNSTRPPHDAVLLFPTWEEGLRSDLCRVSRYASPTLFSCYQDLPFQLPSDDSRNCLYQPRGLPQNVILGTPVI